MHASPSELTSPMQIEFAIDIESQSVDVTVNHLLCVGGVCGNMDPVCMYFLA